VSRFLYAATNSAAQLPQLQYRQLVDVGVTSGMVYACNGTQYLYALGNTYTPVGHLGTIDPIQEENDPFPRTVRCTLQAVGSADFYEAFREDMFGRPLRVYHVLLNEDKTMVSTPEPLWSGLINRVQLHFNTADRGTYLEVEADTDLQRAPAVMNYTRESMLLIASGDTFFNFIDQVPLTKAQWGREATHFAGNAPSKSSGYGGTYSTGGPLGRALHP
jgi:hypothetical protein